MYSSRLQQGPRCSSIAAVEGFCPALSNLVNHAYGLTPAETSPVANRPAPDAHLTTVGIRERAARSASLTGGERNLHPNQYDALLMRLCRTGRGSPTADYRKAALPG
jgi:hypothetical protein